MRHSTAFESQVRLAEAGHWRFLNSRRREVEARRREPASGGGGTGGGGSGGGGKGKGKRAAEEAPSSSGLPRARGGEKRGLSDIDETDVGKKQSHGRYIEQTDGELQKKFDNKPKQLVNYHMAHGAGEQAGRLIGSFMLHHQHDVSSWRNQVPSVLQQLEAKYQEYVDANPGAKCTELEIIQEAILWVAMIIPILARPVPPPPPAFGDEDSPVKPKANKPPPAFGNEDEDEEHN